MKKFIKSSLLTFTLLLTIIVNGCDIFENFQFGLPVSFEIESTGTTSPFGSAFYCLTDNETYNDYEEDINSITFVAAYIVTREVNPTTLSGDAVLRLYEGTNSSGQLLFEHTATNLTPADHDSTNAYKIEFTSAEIANVNQSLNSGNRCFYGEYLVQNISGGGVSNYIRVKIDALFSIDADLN
jgi:hypothetical protein